MHFSVNWAGTRLAPETLIRRVPGPLAGMSTVVVVTAVVVVEVVDVVLDAGAVVSGAIDVGVGSGVVVGAIVRGVVVDVDREAVDAGASDVAARAGRHLNDREEIFVQR